MRASTSIRVIPGSGRAVVDSIRCEAPLLVRVDGAADVLTLLLVGGAAGPVGGDLLEFDLEVCDGAEVVVRSIAATLAQPGPGGDPSRSVTRVKVGRGARLDWCTEPLVSVRGSEHDARLELDLARDSSVRLVEHFLLGRSNESPGSLSVRQRVVRESTVVVDHESRLGAGTLMGAGANGPWRWWTSTVVVGDDAPRIATSTVTPEAVTAGFCVADDVWIGIRGASTPLT